MNGLIKDRPLVFFDLETTGTNVLTDRIVELTLVKLYPDGQREVKTRRLNPEMPIPPEATAIHKISDEDVKDAPTFRQISKNLFICLEGCDLGGYNIARFDIPVLVREFARAGLSFSLEGRRIIDVYTIFCRMEPRNLSAAYQFFCGKKMEDAHSAEADTLATVDIFEAQMERYSKLEKSQLPETVELFPTDLDSLHAFCCQQNPDAVDRGGKFKWRNGVAVIGFGRNAGIPLAKIAVDNPDFLRWIIKSDFEADVKKIAADALKGIFPKK